MRFLFFACLAFLFGGGATALTLQGDTPRVDLAAHVQILEDDSGTLTLAQVQAPENATRFQPWSASSGTVNLGFSGSAVWLRVALRRSAEAPQRWLLEIPNAKLNQVALFGPEAPAVMTGSDYPLASRPLLSRFFVFPVSVGPDTQHFYLRIQSNYARTIPLLVWQPTAYVENQYAVLGMQFLYYGGMLALLLYNLLLYLSLKDRRFLIYSVYVLLCGVGVFAGNGFGRLFGWPDAPQFDDISQSLFLSFAAIAAVLLAQEFLQTHTRQPLVHALLRCANAVFFLVGMALLGSLWFKVPASFTYKVLMVNALAAGALILWNSVQALRSGNKSVRFSLWAWAVLWTGISVAALHAFGWVPSNPVTAYALQISTALEMLLLALALADIVHSERQQREHMQSEALRAHQKMLDVLRTSEERLENAVQRRTEELRVSLLKEKELLAQYVRFGSLISHEFRNPLGIIQSQLSLVRKEKEHGIDQIDKRMGIAQSAVQRLVALFNKWLQSDRLEGSLQSLSMQQVPLCAWLQRQIEANAYCLAQHHVELRCAEPQLHMHADASLMEIALNNLLENASKFSPPNTPIVVEAHHCEGHVAIAVADQGIGIAAEHHASAFEQFFRVAPQGAVQGMGLGLYLVRQIVQAHGGRIELTSRPAQGSRFCMWIPDQQERGTPCQV